MACAHVNYLICSACMHEWITCNVPKWSSHCHVDKYQIAFVASNYLRLIKVPI